MDRKVRYPSVRNPRELVEQFYTVLDSMDDTVLVEPVMAAEDFAEYQQEIPGLFFFLGVQEPTGTAPLHSSHFNFDERVFFLRTLPAELCKLFERTSRSISFGCPS